MNEVLSTILTVAVIAALVVGAIALGLKFFNTSTEEEERAKGWDDER
jgi:hypothetical protein